ncbi:MAG: rRNA maturation RNase YbeY [Flavobacteriales bacterium]|nr:rRNA maturation RNase YbeY [Flavobacteriales bacterium]|tara:strand:+ start:334611 stop:335015 length:405 start_codon:yes stop_codon:yes gene_type:complete
MISFQYINENLEGLKENKKWIEGIVLSENKSLGNIVIVFCNDQFLLEKNIKYLNHNTLTDVISFDYSTKNKIHGDILISVERVKENARLYNQKFSTELNRVMAHGLLHLLGYKDKSEEDAKIMRSKENYYLSKL